MVLRARVKLERLSIHKGHNILDADRQRHLKRVGDCGVVAHRIVGAWRIAGPTALVLQQVQDRDLPQSGIRRLPFRWRQIQDIGNPVMQFDFAILHQAQDGCRREGFGDAGNTKDGGWLHDFVRLCVPTKPACIDQTALKGKGQLAAWNTARLHELLH